jgi:hypothetical protein
MFALKANSTGGQNTAVGGYSLRYNTTGGNNTASGYQALYSNTTAPNNTAIGYVAGTMNTTGSDNTFVGAYSGNYTYPTTTGVHNTIVGALAHCSSATGRNQIVLGRYCRGIGDYYFVFGTDGGADRVYNQYNSNASWTRASDERIKKDIQDNNDCGLDFINDLRTVTYKFKAPSELDSTMSEYDATKTEATHKDKMYGFVAQEVKASLDKHNITDFNGWHQIEAEGQNNLQGISYEMFVMPLVKAVQELSAENKALMTRIQALENA